MTDVVTDDGVRLALRDSRTGAPGAPVVVLVPGFTAPAATWVLQEDALQAAGYRTVAVDMRGHGDSDSPQAGHTMARRARDVRAVLTALELDDVVLVGGSMGASTGWAYVAEFGTDRLRGLVSADQTPAMLTTDDWPFGMYGLTPETLPTYFADGIPATGRGRTDEQQLPALQRLVARLGGVPAFVPPTAPHLQEVLLDHAAADWRGVVAGVDVPFLVVAAAQSQLWPAEHAAATVGGNALGRAVVVPDAGHAVNVDAADAFDALLLGFLAGL